MVAEPRDMVLIISADEQDEERLAELTRLLQAELQELDVEQVKQVESKDIPEGARAGASTDLGVLAVQAAPAVIGYVLAVVQSWIRRGRDRSAELNWKGNKIKVTGVASEEQKRLIDAWVNRVEAG
jgi:hypothetical protein